MKLTLPLEHRIQQKGEKYADDELMRDAMEVRDLKWQIKHLERQNRFSEGCFWVLLAFSIIGSFGWVYS